MIKIAAFCSTIIAIFLWYYLTMTHYDVRFPDQRIVYDGNSLSFPYGYRKSVKDTRKYTDFDSCGFATINVNGRYYRQPMTHCNHALYYFNRYLENEDENDKLRFLALAQALIDNGKQVTIDGTQCVVWFYDFQVPGYPPHHIPWISAISQGRAISVLCRAFQMTHNDQFLNAALSATGPFHFDCNSGGLIAKDQEGNLYYEEYPFSGNSHHVLNGFITSLFGLHELYRVTGDTVVYKLFKQGISTLRKDNVLHRYDLGFWTTYSQAPDKPMAFKYQATHVIQMLELANITGDKYFKDTAHKWLQYNIRHRYRIRFFINAALHYFKHSNTLSAKILFPKK